MLPEDITIIPVDEEDDDFPEVASGKTTELEKKKEPRKGIRFLKNYETIRMKKEFGNWQVMVGRKFLKFIEIQY